MKSQYGVDEEEQRLQTRGTKRVVVAQHSGLFRAVVHQRCPRCRRGFVYRRGSFKNNLCPVCGLEFDREEGYYTGAIFFGYVLAVPTVLFFFFMFCLLFPDIDLVLAALLSMLLLIPLVPLILRLSHVIWIGVDRALRPD
jgi:uncharacterized protein (DUF983 family)